MKNIYTMKMTTLITLLFLTFYCSAQDFLDGNFTFSSSKISYITLADGSEVTGYIDDIDRKKGLIEKITIKDSLGKKMEFQPQDIHHMYIAPSKWDKFSKGMDKMNDFTEWDKNKQVNLAHIKEGYALFEYSEVMIKNEKKSLLLQLINPGYCNKIKVFFDPQAKESASVGIGGFSVAGGQPKSYYVKVGNEVAYKLEKKHYEDKFESLFGNCEAINKAYPEEIDWDFFSKHVYIHATKCD
ncbi:MAG: hypothetical protein U0V54_03750 [Saprospiraceae bacterium]|nr:hypothetical protein [Saprospiraceae bacterium]